MDTSETYIKMCDCPEIQEGWQPKTGDWHHHYSCNEEEDHSDVIDYDEIDNEDNIEHIIEHSIWLPRQDQLQAMVLPILREKWQKIKLVENQVVKPVRDINREGNWFVRVFSSYLTDNPGVASNSMEQLWLAFVMKEKFNKTWDGEKWEIVN